ncbi:1-acyl-sn-glycerol-3-phosphate acyltransferase [Kitasatospora gansuensis]|uniref:1-acyl-sn-glycerol-3-phosphate acyltransferase n=1 Tax=Kitasatospora gansuensis TaxID=258050 RepID=A0A7W7S6U7_9ACTN|nr:lysophospholipid acyltransferase family protein [Kitasatospora gansuensis]MBB4944991.1 1-acyl-sn-glycerol-3-phosphate acyltransferase [Kitasatospora gansuensis]
MSSWLPTAPCTPESCLADPGPRVSAPLRLLRGFGSFGPLLAGIAVVVLTRGWGRVPRLRDGLLRLWTRSVLAGMGVRLRVVGTPAPGAVLRVANHISWLDIVLFTAVRPGPMLAKTEVRSWPVVGALTGLGGTVFIDRDRLRQLPGTVREMAAVLRSGRPVTAFPEGSTWCGAAGGRFRPAAFQAAIDAGAPVQPVTIRYQLPDGRLCTAPAYVGDDELLPSIRRLLGTRGVVAELVFHSPMPTNNGTDRRLLARRAQAAVGSHLGADHRVDRPHVPAQQRPQIAGAAAWR